MTMVKRVLFWLWQCTWGLPQTLAGLAVFAWCRAHGAPVLPNFHGAVVTQWGRGESLSLGMFIFVTADPPRVGRLNKEESARRLLVHEYGHCLQSLLLGPLYLPVIAAPSGIWCNSKRLQKRRRENKISYYSFFTERWANAWAEKILHQPGPGLS